MKKYNSTKDTLLHKKRVQQLLTEASIELLKRGMFHDDFKLEKGEKELFDEYTSKLANCTYGSDEYNQFLKELKPALKHHYAVNSHHPEHYENGVDDMNLFDIIEMFLDWKSASERHNDGDIYKSLDINKKRFKMADQLYNIFKNTADELF